MGLNCGIVGLPNVGKSTIFSAMTSAPAEAANYPFCTIDPNVGIVAVPDLRLGKLTEFIPTAKVIPAVVEFVDIAGLVKGASKGEGLGNRFLSHIRDVGIIVHVVRCFKDEDVVHVDNKIDSASDIETINIELALADLETVEKRRNKTEKALRAGNKDAIKKLNALRPILARLEEALGNGKPARSLEFTEEQLALIYDMHLITIKKQIYVCNIDENSINTPNEHVETVKKIAEKEGMEVVIICGKLEAEIASLDSAVEKQEFMEAAGLRESGMDTLIHTGYRILGLRTFFTAGADENRAWTFHAGAKAPQTAGIIHTDFEKGFIKADVYSFEDISTYKTEQKVKEAGRLRIEGKEYLVQDGDIIHFKFNV